MYAKGKIHVTEIWVLEFSKAHPTREGGVPASTQRPPNESTVPTAEFHHASCQPSLPVTGQQPVHS
jgi:hypothetical protein